MNPNNEQIKALKDEYKAVPRTSEEGLSPTDFDQFKKYFTQELESAPLAGFDEVLNRTHSFLQDLSRTKDLVGKRNKATDPKVNPSYGDLQLNRHEYAVLCRAGEIKNNQYLGRGVAVGQI